MQKFQFTHSQVFVMNFSCDSGWHYMSLKFSNHKIHGHNTLHNLEKQRLIVRKLLVPIPKKNVVWLINQRSGMAETLGCEILRLTLMSSSLSPVYLITIITFSALELLLLHMKYEFSLIDFYVSLISRYS